MTDFLRFPHTPHLAWLGEGQPRDDKVLASEEATDLLSGEVVVEEKVDGANLGFSVSENGDLRCQNRGSYLTRQACPPQFRPLWPWLAPRIGALIGVLRPHRILFGEWCLAVHSIRYDRLPDWFLGFDVYDRVAGHFWDTGRRNALLAEAGLHPVPQLARGHFTLATLQALLGVSRLGDVPMEGMVVRREASGRTLARAKLVRAAFAQEISEHWSRGPLRRNALAPGVSETRRRGRFGRRPR